jgi:glycosyltransferase involved in cell wall biosynthesis
MKIAFVTPWFGVDIPGGMESETRRTAVQLQAAGHKVEVLTTCIRDFFSDWGQNYHKPGVTTEAGLTVRRFPVSAGDQLAFQEVNRRLLRGQAISEAEEAIFAGEMFDCPDLYTYIADHCQAYIFFFIPYLYATTIFGATICPQRSVLIPCLHDESYAYMDLFRQIMPLPQAMVLQVNAERDLVERLYGSASHQIRRVIGTGVDTDFVADAARFRRKYKLDGSIILAVGRRDPGKNTPLLLAYWQRYVRETGTKAKLVLIGPGEIVLDQEMEKHVLDFGYVPLQDKYDAYAAADLLCQPSVHESFSLVIMEAWLTGTPVVVNGDCAVTTEHCRRANGGLYFTNYAEFSATITYVLDRRDVARKMGYNGREYVLANYQWPQVIDRYEALLSEIEDDRKR